MSLVDQWQRLIAEEPDLPEHEADKRAEALHTETLRALVEDPAARDELLAAFRRTGDEELRYRLEGVILPPNTQASFDPGSYRAHPEVGFDETQFPIRVALGLPVAEDLGGDPGYQKNPLGQLTSWFAGLPAVPHTDAAGWSPPQRSDGTPLTHVVQVDLGTESENQGADLFAATGLPRTGIIQLFHDLETYGEPGDDPTAWRVTWLPGPADQLTIPAGGGDELVPFIPINAQTMATAPNVLEVTNQLSQTDGDRYARARDWLEQAPSLQNAMALGPADGIETGNETATPWDEDYEPPFPASRMGGYPAADTSDEVREVLNRQLPLAGSDDHVLLFDINPQAVGAPDDWFHGGRHLEVWVRNSDLTASRFDQVWAIIRADA